MWVEGSPALIAASGVLASSGQQGFRNGLLDCGKSVGLVFAGERCPPVLSRVHCGEGVFASQLRVCDIEKYLNGAVVPTKMFRMFGSPDLERHVSQEAAERRVVVGSIESL